MALPVGLSTVTVSAGPYTDAIGVPYSGSLTFSPNVFGGQLLWAATGAVILDGDVTVQLDAAGSALVVLPATDVVGLSTLNFTYTVSWSLKSASKESSARLPIIIQLPQATTSVDLDVLIPMSSAGGITVGTPGVVSVAGLTGAPSAAAVRTALGLGSAALVATSAFDAAGAAATAQAASVQRAANLSDLASAATALANLAGAPLASPALTGTPTVPTAASGTNTTQAASTAYVIAALDGGVL